MLHASGKFVSLILNFLQPSLTSEQSAALTEFHDLTILKLLTASSETDDATTISEQLQKKMDKIKSIASTYKKIGTTNAE